MAKLDKIKKVVEKSGYKKNYLARKLGVTPVMFGTYLSGKNPFTLNTVKWFMEFFPNQFDVKDFFGD